MNFFDKRNNRVKRKFVQKKFWVQQNFTLKKYFFRKYFDPEIKLGPKNLATNFLSKKMQQMCLGQILP